MAILHRFFWIGSLFLATLITGIWLGLAGRALHPALSGFHKLLALAWVAFAAIRFYHLAGQMRLSEVLIGAIAVLGLCMITLIASGSVLTLPSLASANWVVVHSIASAIAVAAFGITLRLLALTNP
jgi:branched-subunit amino acid transport protein